MPHNKTPIAFTSLPLESAPFLLSCAVAAVALFPKLDAENQHEVERDPQAKLCVHACEIPSLGSLNYGDSRVSGSVATDTA